MGGEEEWGWCRATAETPPPRATNVDLLDPVRSSPPRAPRACGAVQVGLAFASRYTRQDSVLAAKRWSDCVRPGVSPQMGWSQRHCRRVDQSSCRLAVGEAG